MNGENDLDEFRGPVGPEACRRRALGYAYNRSSVNTRSDTTVLYIYIDARLTVLTLV